MSIRTTFAGIASVAVGATVLSIASPAMAAYNALPNDTKADTAVTSVDVLGFGSDTTEISVNEVAKAWNTANAATKGYSIASFQAGAQPAGGTITLPDGTTANRPNGSGDGKKWLMGATNQPEADFARSSSSLSTGAGSETEAGLLQIPFAVDTLAMGVSASGTYAPASLSMDQIYKIYTGEYTNWSQVGGANQPIHASALQQSSGTAKFFQDQLKAYASSHLLTFSMPTSINTTWQEHSDTNVKDDPSAIAPFSVGRAGLLGGTIKIETGWSKDRAVYNVVRGSSNTAAGLHWGTDNGVLEDLAAFFCKPEAKAGIEAGGLKQMLNPADGGACGVASQSTPAAAKLVSSTVATTTTVTDSGSAAGVLQATATIAAGTGSPQGTVDFFVDGAASAAVSGVAVSGGQAVATIQGLAAGVHSVKAVYTKQDGTAYQSSQGTGSASVRAASSVSVAPITTTYGQAGSVTATVTGSSTGTVVFQVDGGAGTPVAVSGGLATFALPAGLPAGAHGVTATFQKTDLAAASAGSTTVTVNKANVSSLTHTFPAITAKKTPGTGTITVTIPGTVKADGIVQIFQTTGKGKRAKVKLITQAALVNGQVTITLPAKPKGKKKLTITYTGSANVNAFTIYTAIKQR